MKTIIAGSRTINDPLLISAAVAASGFSITEVVCGCAQGVDIQGYYWAMQNNIACVKFPANWKKYGKRAGFIRNAEMAKYAEALIAIWDGKSNGTRNMIELAKQWNLKTFIHVVK